MTSVVSAAVDWQALARSATATSREFTVWKHGDRLARPGGDLDCTASRSAWPDVAVAVGAWAADLGCTHLARCEHVPGTLVLVAAGGAIEETLLQVDLVARRPLAAGAWFDAGAVAAAATVDERGIRRLAPGAEGLLRLLDDPLDVEARALLRADPGGAEALAVQLALPQGLLFGSAAGSRAYRAAAAVVASARTLMHPTRERPLQRYRPCAVTAALARGRRAAPTYAKWLDAVRAGHEVDDLA